MKPEKKDVILRYLTLRFFTTRFFDWLSGGAPNVAKLNSIKGRSFFWRHSVTCVMSITALAVLIGPEIVSQINGIPAEKELKTLQVHILRTHITEPHLFVELPDGTQRGMELPVPISAGGGFTPVGWTKMDTELLAGCFATVQGVPLRWTLRDRFRVWALQCPEKRLRIDFADTKHGFEVWMNIRNSSAPIFFSIAFGLIIVVFLRERRGNL